jgi:hypothetical protein
VLKSSYPEEGRLASRLELGLELGLVWSGLVWSGGWVSYWSWIWSGLDLEIIMEPDDGS